MGIITGGEFRSSDKWGYRFSAVGSMEASEVEELGADVGSCGAKAEYVCAAGKEPLEEGEMQELEK